MSEAFHRDPHTLSGMKNNEGTASYAESREEILRLTGRGYATPRHILVQLPDSAPSRPSTLGRLVHARKHRALVLYLLLLTTWSLLENRDRPLEGKVWARLLSTDKGRRWTPSEISDAWADLEAAGLITREREGRSLRVRPRREDGAAEWTRPGGTTGDWYETFFVLPGAFWRREHFATLSLAALAVLLIVLKETSNQKECWLTYEKAQDWYGISASTVQKGTKELEDKGLLDRRPQTIKAPLSPTGNTTRWWYSLPGDYSYAARRAGQARAKKETVARAGGAAAKTPGHGRKKAAPAKTAKAGSTSTRRKRSS